jgi:hypothetical protein
MIDYPYYNPQPVSKGGFDGTQFNVPFIAPIKENMNTNLSKALLAAQKEIKNPTKEATNPFFKSKYANLNTVLEACKQALLDVGVYITQGSRLVENNMVEVYTTFTHGESGESRTDTVVMSLKDTGPQATGSVLSYGRRYSLMAALNLAAEDDDANVAQGVTGAAQLARPKGK